MAEDNRLNAAEIAAADIERGAADPVARFPQQIERAISNRLGPAEAQRVELAERSGLRVWLAPWYSSSHWYVDNRHEVKFEWDEKAGRQKFNRSMDLIRRIQKNPSGRLSGMVYPAQIDTCTEELLRASAAAATELGVPLTTHAAQSIMEFNLMVQRHGKTPIQWAHEIGFLGPSTTLGRAIFVDEHSWLHWYSREDVKLLADSADPDDGESSKAGLCWPDDRADRAA